MTDNRNLDVLLVGRPDHSMLIYRALTKQSVLSFHFITFKVLPRWMKCFVRKFHVQFIDKHVSISPLTTFINICKYPLGLKIAKNWKETGRLAPLFARVTKKSTPRLIHYWSSYAHVAIEDFAAHHPDTIVIKDIHMPAFATVYKAMQPVADKYKMPELASEYRLKIDSQAEELKNTSVILVPSRYVMESYRTLFPDKTYYMVSYGITRYGNYVRKNPITDGHKFRFVYVGRISLEKGCDILFEYFNHHPEYELHVYGSMVGGQSGIFKSLESSNIVLHGPIPKNMVQSEAAKYDIGIHLSRFDAYSLGVGEMIGAGLPVIVSTATGIEVDIKTNDWGEVTDNTSDDIERAVVALTNTARYNHVIQSIDSYLKGEHSDYGESMVKFYQDLINKID